MTEYQDVSIVVSSIWRSLHPADAPLNGEHRSAPASKRRSIRSAWIRACVVGELVGFLPPAVVGAALFALEVPELALILGLVIAGIGEGVVLGHSQSRVVSQLFPEVSGWAAATATAAGLAWLAGMGGSALVQIEPTWLVVVVPGWIVALLSMGYLQASRLASATDDAYDWVGVTTAGWLVGVALPVVALSVMPNDWPLLLHVVAAVVAAVAMGATVGAVSAPTLYRLAASQIDEAILH